MIRFNVSALIVSLVLTQNVILLLDRHLNEKGKPEKHQEQSSEQNREQISGSISESAEQHINTSTQPIPDTACTMCPQPAQEAHHYYHLLTNKQSEHAPEAYRVSSLAITWIIGFNMIALAIFIRATR